MAKPYKKYSPEELDAAIKEQIAKRKAAFELSTDPLVDIQASNAAYQKWHETGHTLHRLNAEKRRRAQKRVKHG